MHISSAGKRGVQVAPTFPVPKRLRKPCPLWRVVSINRGPRASRDPIYPSRPEGPTSGTPAAAQNRPHESSFYEGNPPTAPAHRHQEIDMHQNLHTQQHEAPLSLWIAAGVAALAYITALNFATYWALSGTVAVVAAVSAVRWLRSRH